MTTLNRAQRRQAAKNAKAKPKAKSRLVAPVTFTFNALFNNQAYDSDHQMPVDLGGETPKDWMLRINNRHALALQKLHDGALGINEAEPGAIVGEMIATGYERAMEIDPDPNGPLITIFTVACNSLKAIYTRRNRFAKWEMLEAEYTALLDASDAFGQIMSLSTPNQMRNACKRSFDFWNTAKDAT